MKTEIKKYRTIVPYLLFFPSIMLLIISMFYIIVQLLDDKSGFDFYNFFENLFISYPALMGVSVLDFIIIKWCSRIKSLKNRFIMKLLTEIMLASIMSGIAVIFINLFFRDFTNFNEYLKELIFGPSVSIAVLINLIILFILEFLVNYEIKRRSEAEYEKLRTENLSFLYEQLRSQINPHFLFNSLNILISLINKDKDKSIEYIQTLSKVYRYVLTHDREELIKLSEEMVFINHYLDILMIRFGDGLKVSSNITKEHSGKYLSPMTLQLLVENAVKHNVISPKNPLTVNFYSEGNYLVVSNKLNKKRNSLPSTGTGLNNLKHRYKILKTGEIIVEEDENFTVKVPLI